MPSKQIDLVMDTSEQKPPIFPDVYKGYKVVIHRRPMETGDYSIVGHSGTKDEPKGLAIERKQHLGEFIKNAFSPDQSRFERQLLRMRFFRVRVLIIGEPLECLYMGNLRTRVPPQAIESRLKLYSERYGLTLYTVHPEQVAEEILGVCRRYIEHPANQGKRSIVTNNQEIKFTRAMASRIGERFSTHEAAIHTILEQLDNGEATTT